MWCDHYKPFGWHKHIVLLNGDRRMLCDNASCVGITEQELRLVNKCHGCGKQDRFCCSGFMLCKGHAWHGHCHQHQHLVLKHHLELKFDIKKRSLPSQQCTNEIIYLCQQNTDIRHRVKVLFWLFSDHTPPPDIEDPDNTDSDHCGLRLMPLELFLEILFIYVRFACMDCVECQLGKRVYSYR